MIKKRIKKGQGAIIIFVIFIVVILLIVGVTLSLSQSKAITRVVYAESNMRTYYAAQAGIQEVMATRLVPRSNLYAINYSIAGGAGGNPIIASINSILPGLFPNQTGMTIASGTLPPIYPNTGVLLTNPDSTPTIGNMTDLRENVLGTYIYTALGGSTETNTVASPGRPLGMPGNTINERVTVFSVGYSLLPDGKIDKLGIIATLDFDRTDNDPTNSDEIESLQITEDPAFISNVENNHLTRPSTGPQVSRMVAFTPRKVYLDVASNNFKTAVLNNPVDYPQLLTLIPDTGTSSGSYPATANTTYRVATTSQVRVFFDKPIDPRSVTNSHVSVQCTGTFDTDGICDTSNPEVALGGSALLPNMPTSNAIIILPPAVGSGNFVYSTYYDVAISNIQDYDGNIMTGPVVFKFLAEPKPLPTDTPTVTSSPTHTPTDTSTVTDTSTITNTRTNTRTFTNTRTPTRTRTFTNTPTATNTINPLITPTSTYTSTDTPTPTMTGTPTNTRTRTNTGTPTNTRTFTNTRTNTFTRTNTGTPTDTPTITNTPTVTNTPTHTSTPTPMTCRWVDEGGEHETTTNCWCRSNIDNQPCICGTADCAPRSW